MDTVIYLKVKDHIQPILDAAKELDFWQVLNRDNTIDEIQRAQDHLDDAVLAYMHARKKA